MPAEFLVIPSSNTNDAGGQQEVEPPRLLGAALDPHRGQEPTGGKEDPNSKHDFVELSLEPNSEGSSDLLRSPAGPDGQKRRNRTDTMIFSEAVNIAEDLAKAQTETELEEPTSFTEVSTIEEVAEVPLISEVISSIDDAAPVSSDPSLEFDDHIPTDEVEEIPLPSITDSEPAVAEDTDESSDEEVVPEEEIPDPAVTEPPVPPEIPAPEPPPTIVTEPSLPETAQDEGEPEPTDVPEPAQSTPETSEHPAEVEVTPTTTDDDEDVEDVEEEEDDGDDEATSVPGPPLPEATDGDGDDEDDNESEPVN